MTNGLLNVAQVAADTIASGDISTKTMTLGERATYCLQRTLIGMTIVFGVLAVIWAVLSLFKVIFYTIPQRKKKNSAVVQAQIEETPVTDTSADDSDEEIVAAIMAAITAMRSDEGTTGGFRVVSFKRLGKAHPWNNK